LMSLVTHKVIIKLLAIFIKITKEILITIILRIKLFLKKN